MYSFSLSLHLHSMFRSIAMTNAIESSSEDDEAGFPPPILAVETAQVCTFVFVHVYMYMYQ